MIHPTADVSPKASIGEGTKVWHHAQIREGAVIGRECTIGKDVYIDYGVRVGDRCKLQNGVNIYHGVSLGDGVFMGPGAMCLNDKYPRAVNVDGSLKTDADWQVSHTHIAEGAGIGGGAIILPGVNIGRWAIVGSGSVIAHDVPDHGLAYGLPARLRGFVCKCAKRLQATERRGNVQMLICPDCEETINIPWDLFKTIEADLK